jgi:hypothetical protein
MDAVDQVLITALRHAINEPSIEAGFQRFRTISGADLDFGSFADAVASCLREGLVKEPVRLPEGSLQCHWHLELTARGVAEARRILDAEEETDES